MTEPRRDAAHDPQTSGGNQPGINRSNPWPGLASFTEQQSDLFFGRQDEAEELFRLVRRDRLTVLHGQSGLGKTSLLQAGLFSRLRQHDYLPVLLRVDYSPRALPPVEQIKVALTQAIREGDIDAPLPRLDRSLWEYFHDPETDFWSPRNRLLTPVLVFDQFEELFTIGQNDETSRRRGMTFVNELACLVENVPPPEIADRLDAGVGSPVAGGLDLARQSGKFVLSLRSDFLAELESLTPLAHGLTRNRMHLRRMTGVQALEVVTGPGAELVQSAVARQIVQFVAGEAVPREAICAGSAAPRGPDAQVEHLEVEPALLSLVCRELNTRRQSAGLTTITAALLAGHRQGILDGFYEHCMQGMPASMRRFIEDRLLTRSGYRNNVAVEDAVASDGVARSDIDHLVSGRLLRTDDRLGVLRVELAHDVLTTPVRASRDVRHSREAAAAAAENEREASRRLRATRRRLAAYLSLAGVVAVIMTTIAGAAIYSRNQAVQLRKQADENEKRAVAIGKLAEERGRLAELQHRVALSRQLAAQALNLGDTRLDLALLLDLEAYKVDANIDARAGLLPLLQIQPRPASFLSRHGDESRAVTFSDDGKLVASGGNEGVVILCDVASRQTIARLSQPAGVRAVAFRPGGTTLATGASDGTVLLWDLTANPPRSRKLTNTGDGVMCVKFAPDGARLGVAIDRDGNDLRKAAIEIWDVDQSTPKPPARLHLIGIAGRDGQRGGVHSLAFTHDGGLLAAGCRYGPIVLWDLTAEPYVPTQLLGHASAVESVAFSPDEKLLASGGYDGLLGLWDVQNPKPLVSLVNAKSGPIWNVAFVGNELVASAQQDRAILFWKVPTLARLSLEWTGHDSAVFGLAVSPDRQYIASVGGDGLMLLWQAPWPDGRPSTEGAVAQDVRVGNPPLWIRSDGGVAFAAGGRLVAAAGTFDDAVYWLDPTARPPKIKLRSPAGQGGIKNVAASPDGRFAASAGVNGSVVLWDLTADPPHAAPLGKHAGVANAVAFSADSSLLASVGDDATKPVLLWDLVSSRALDPPPALGTVGASVAFGPPGSNLLAWGGVNGTLNLWDLKQRTYIPFSPSGSITSLLSIAFSSDGKMAYSGRNAGRHAYLWDLKAGRPIDPPLDGPGGDWVFGLAFSPDGKMLAGASGEILLWDVASHHLLGRPFNPRSTQFAVSFSPDSKKLAAWSGASNVCLIDVDFNSWTARAKAIANRKLTEAERAFYMGE